MKDKITIVKLYKKSIIIEDMNQHECVELENYHITFHGISSGIYVLVISKDSTNINIKNIITVRTNNLIVIDKR